MKASEKRLEDFLNERNVTFIIPVYQRNYDWTKEQCKQLIEDIESLAKRERDSHFLGSIVYTKGSDIEVIEKGLKEYIIIDGQQRITTSIILLKAIYDLLDDEWDKEEIYDNYFINKFKKENKLKLKPIKEDNEVFERLFKNEKINKESKIYQNYLFFKDYLENSNIDIKNYYKSFRRLWIVYIELDREKDNPQLIFESINSTGLSLTQADLIRNFILMDKSAEEQNYLFESYWSKIENLLGNDNISNFIRDYLTMKENFIPNKKDVYKEFKRFYKNTNLNTENLLKELLYFAQIYHCFLYFDFKNEDINILLKEISIDLNTKVVFPFFLSLFNEFYQKHIDENTLLKSVKLIRNYIFRRLICEYSSNALNKIFMSLYKEISKIENFYENFYENLAFILLNKRGQGTFPKDEEFKEYFISKDMYKFKAKKYLLYSLEKFNNKEVVKEDNLTIEHIMPQKINTKWSLMLGNKYKEIHEKYLHNIGNLTLTAYNSNLSNKDFEEKKEILTKSNIGLNKYFQNVYKWDKEEIEKRANFLFEIVKNIWKIPNLDKKILLPEENIYNLNDFFEVTGRKIKKIEILGESIKINSWIEAFTKSCETFYMLDKEKFISFVKDKDFEGREKRIISNNLQYLRKPIEIKNSGVYIESNLSANSILNYIKLIAEKFSFSGDDMIFYIE